MGNASAIYKDPSQWTLADYNEFIREAILSNPWNPISSESKLSDEEKLRHTIEFMRSQGVRPITAEEYMAEMRMLRKHGDQFPGKIILWKRIHLPSPCNGSGGTLHDYNEARLASCSSVPDEDCDAGTMTEDTLAAARERFLKRIRLENPEQAVQLAHQFSRQHDDDTNGMSCTQEFCHK